MAIVPNFSTTQPAGTLTSFTITDTSTGSDGTVTGRLITLKKYDGSYLVPTGYTVTYIFWPVVTLSGDTLTVANILDKDYCVDINVRWFAASTAAYTKTILTLFTGYGDTFLRQLTQALSANKITITQNNFWYNKNKLRVLLDDASQAVSLLNDQTIATNCLDEAKKLSDNLSAFL